MVTAPRRKVLTMSHRFPPLASQIEIDRALGSRPGSAQVIALSMLQATSLPWFEILLGAAFLMALQTL